MYRTSSILLCAVASSCFALDHVRVNFGQDPTRSAVISFSSNTSNPTSSFVTYSTSKFTGCGSSSSFSTATTVSASAFDNSYANSAGLQVVYEAFLNDLSPSTTYFYTACIGADEISPLYSFTTIGKGNSIPKVCYWGDLGRDGGGQAWPFLEIEANRTAAREPGSCDLGIQNGDFAYDLGDQKGARGAAFMSRFSGISAQLPTFTTIGNHELPKDLPLDVNASHYVNMLGRSMPGNTNGSYYSVNVGLMHLVFLSSEVMALAPYGGVTVESQQTWLINDLKSVDRSVTPWIVAIFHRPFYCSNANSWCGPNAWQQNPVRLAFEPAFLQFGVDVVLGAHEHSVEYTWPVKEGAATAFDYTNPTAPVHVVAGVAGCNETDGECLNPMGPSAGNWSRVRLAGDPVQYGYSRFWANNSTYFHLEQIQVLVGPTPVVWSEAVDIYQANHGPFE